MRSRASTLSRGRARFNLLSGGAVGLGAASIGVAAVKIDAFGLSTSPVRPGDAESATGDLVIGLAGVDDLESLRVLVAAFRDHLQAATPTDADLVAHLPQALSDPSIEFACAWSRGQAVGYTQTRFLRSVWASGLEALLEDLFVLPAVRGRAIGRSLLRHAMQRARERGARLVGLTTNERNQPAQSLYRSEGFQPQSAKIWPNGREIRWVVRLDEPSG